MATSASSLLPSSVLRSLSECVCALTTVPFTVGVVAEVPSFDVSSRNYKLRTNSAKFIFTTIVYLLCASVQPVMRTGRKPLSEVETSKIQ